jgi:23S rRNA G2445 N2-methylase RlmL
LLFQRLPERGKGFLSKRMTTKCLQFNKIHDTDKLFSKIDAEILKETLKIYCFDKEFRYLNSAKKNAKIAGVDKDINFSRSDVEWMDTKLDKESVDKIITQPPQPTKNLDIKKLTKIYDEFFYQAEFVLKKKGRIIHRISL